MTSSFDRVESVVRTITDTCLASEKYFGDLDSVVGDGDGDFGFSLARGFERVDEGWDAFDARQARRRDHVAPGGAGRDRGPRLLRPGTATATSEVRVAPGTRTSDVAVGRRPYAVGGLRPAGCSAAW